MLRFLPALAVLAALPLAPATAAITYTYSATDQLSDPGQPGSTVVDNFAGIDLAPQTSYWIAGGLNTCATITSTTASCNSAIGSPPVIGGVPDLAGPTGAAPYLAVSNGSDMSAGVGFFQLDLSKLNTNNISFFWGSVDTWNFAQLLDASGNALITVSGKDIGAGYAPGGFLGSLGSRRFTFSWSGTDPVAILQFGDSFGPAFELSNVTSVLPASAVPVPAGIGIAALGFGALTQLRRRRRA